MMSLVRLMMEDIVDKRSEWGDTQYCISMPMEAWNFSANRVTLGKHQLRCQPPSLEP
jgi:hypothetical protein